MKKTLLAFGLVLGLNVPAKATELIINYASDQALAGFAQVLGYWDQTNNTMTTTGTIATGGSYFFNAVGAQPDLPGLWARLRHNGDPAILAAQLTPETVAMAAQFGIVIYQMSETLGCWSADGANCAPEVIGTIGAIM